MVSCTPSSNSTWANWRSETSSVISAPYHSPLNRASTRAPTSTCRASPGLAGAVLLNVVGLPIDGRRGGGGSIMPAIR